MNINRYDVLQQRDASNERLTDLTMLRNENESRAGK